MYCMPFLLLVIPTLFILMNRRTNEWKERGVRRELSKVRKTAGQLKHEQHEAALDTGNAQVCLIEKKSHYTIVLSTYKLRL